MWLVYPQFICPYRLWKEKRREQCGNNLLEKTLDFLVRMFKGFFNFHFNVKEKKKKPQSKKPQFASECNINNLWLDVAPSGTCLSCQVKFSFNSLWLYQSGPVHFAAVLAVAGFSRKSSSLCDSGIMKWKYLWQLNSQTLLPCTALSSPAPSFWCWGGWSAGLFLPLNFCRREFSYIWRKRTWSLWLWYARLNSL